MSQKVIFFSKLSSDYLFPTLKFFFFFNLHSFREMQKLKKIPQKSNRQLRDGKWVLGLSTSWPWKDKTESP